MYDSFSADYDRFVNWKNRLAGELPFIEQQLQQTAPDGPVRVLDAACGTGMHALALAQRGYAAAGADLSAPMVEKARANAAAEGLGLRFEAVGFGGLVKTFGRESFDALLCLGNSLPHLTTPADLCAALKDFAACLRPGGLLLLQNRNFDAVMAHKERWMEPQAHREGDAEWLFMRFYDFLPDGLISFNMATLRRENPQSGWRQSVSSTLLRPLLQADVTDALGQCGFRCFAHYGSLGGEPFDAQNSGNLITVAWV